METVKYEIELEKNLFESLVSAFSYQYSYQETVKDAEGNEIPNPDSPIDFMRKMTGKYWQDVLMAYLRSQAIKTAEASLPNLDVTMDAKAV